MTAKKPCAKIPKLTAEGSLTKSLRQNLFSYTYNVGQKSGIIMKICPQRKYCHFR